MGIPDLIGIKKEGKGLRIGALVKEEKPRASAGPLRGEERDEEFFLF